MILPGTSVPALKVHVYGVTTETPTNVAKFGFGTKQ